LREPGAGLEAQKSGGKKGQAGARCALITCRVSRAHAAETALPRLLTEVTGFLAQRVDTARQAGIARERIVIDPGFGFGKKTGHTSSCCAGLPRIAGLGQPVLVGLSRKSLFR